MKIRGSLTKEKKKVPLSIKSFEDHNGEREPTPPPPFSRDGPQLFAKQDVPTNFHGTKKGNPRRRVNPKRGEQKICLQRTTSPRKRKTPEVMEAVILH